MPRKKTERRLSPRKRSQTRFGESENIIRQLTAMGFEESVAEKYILGQGIGTIEAAIAAITNDAESSKGGKAAPPRRSRARKAVPKKAAPSARNVKGRGSSTKRAASANSSSDESASTRRGTKRKAPQRQPKKAVAKETTVQKKSRRKTQSSGKDRFLKLLEGADLENDQLFDTVSAVFKSFN